MDDHAPLRHGRITRWPHLPAILGYALITVALTWPLAVKLNDAVAHDLGDPLLSATILWWNAHQLPFTNAWWNGPFFFPASDTLALSDHRVGLGLFATPLLWLGAPPIAAYNVTFLLAWWLSAAAAYALGYTVTRSRSAAFLAGCVFGFNPFRAGHLPHLELLAAYCLPLVLVALHQWRDTRLARWLVLLGGAWLLQALTSGYFFFFMAVFVGLWLLWFHQRVTAREYALLAASLIAPLLVTAPILLRYSHAHDIMRLARSITEIQSFSADVTGFLTPPEPLSLWNFFAGWRRAEGDLLPGITAVVLVIAAFVLVKRRQPDSDPRSRVLAAVRPWLLGVSMCAVAAALTPILVGPLAFSVAGVPVSMTGSDKPLSVAFIAGVLWLLTSRRFVAARRTQSKFAFYAVAMSVMWLLAMGPSVRLLGHAVLYQAPYAWLMWLPGFDDAFRAPARFAMLAVLALSAAAALALGRLASRWPAFSRPAVPAMLVVAVLAESWIYPFPLAAAPPRLDVSAGLPASAVIMELPTGVFEDALATFHATAHGRRVVNGLSGYNPPHYTILSRALSEGNVAVLDVLRRYADIAVFVRRDNPDAARLTAQVRRLTAAVALQATTTHEVTLLPLLAHPGPVAAALEFQELRPVMITGEPSSPSMPLLIDDDYDTGWETVAAQQGSESMILSLDQARPVSGVRLALGGRVASFPRSVTVDVSDDGVTWSPAAVVDAAAAALEAALADPRRVDVTIRFDTRRARHLRITQTGRSTDGWAVVEARVLAGPLE